jgi:hypothetical protein
MSHPFEMADLALADESVVRRTGSVAAPRSAINPAATNFTARSPAPALRLLISIRRARPAEKSRPRRGGRSTPPCFTGKPIRKSHPTVSVPKTIKKRAQVTRQETRKSPPLLRDHFALPSRVERHFVASCYFQSSATRTDSRSTRSLK